MSKPPIEETCDLCGHEFEKGTPIDIDTIISPKTFGNIFEICLDCYVNKIYTCMRCGKVFHENLVKTEDVVQFEDVLELSTCLKCLKKEMPEIISNKIQYRR